MMATSQRSSAEAGAAPGLAFTNEGAHSAIAPHHTITAPNMTIIVEMDVGVHDKYETRRGASGGFRPETMVSGDLAPHPPARAGCPVFLCPGTPQGWRQRS